MIYLYKNDQQTGPYTLDEVKARLISGEISEADLAAEPNGERMPLPELIASVTKREEKAQSVPLRASTPPEATSRSKPTLRSAGRTNYPEDKSHAPVWVCACVVGLGVLAWWFVPPSQKASNMLGAVKRDREDAYADKLTQLAAVTPGDAYRYGVNQAKLRFDSVVADRVAPFDASWAVNDNATKRERAELFDLEKAEGLLMLETQGREAGMTDGPYNAMTNGFERRFDELVRSYVPRTGGRSSAGHTDGDGVSSPLASPKAQARYRRPIPTYPYQARATNVQGNGVCHVTFDSEGRVASAVMKQSTGSDILDKNTIGFVKAYWTGEPDSNLDAPVGYKLR